MAQEEAVVALRATGEGPFTQAFARARDAVRGVATEGESSSRGFGAMAKNLAGAAGGAAVVKKGFDFLKSAANDAGTLAKSTAALSRQTGMDSTASSAWVSMAKQRGIETKALQTSFTAFSKQLSGAQSGSKGAGEAMKALGVDVEGLKAGTTDFYGALMQASEGFAALPEGADKTALAVKAFGKQGLALLPILNNGSAALEDQMGAMQKAGLTLDKSGVQKSLELAKAQREMRTQMAGVKTQIGQALIPVLVTFAQVLVPIVSKIADLLRKSPVLTGAVVALAVAFGALLVIAKIAAMLKALGISITIVQVALGAGILGIIIAIAAGLVLAYNKVGWFRDAVDTAFRVIKGAISAVFNWVKTNWPLLLMILTGPIGAAVILIIKNWDTVKNATVAAFNAVKGAILAAANFVGTQIARMVGFVKSLPGQVASVASNAFKSIVDAAKSAAEWAWKQFLWLVDQIKGLPGKIAGFVGSLGSQVGSALKEAVKSVLPGPLASLLGTGGIVAAQTGLAAGGGKNVLVGERGPEMLSLPSGSRVTPLPPPSLAASQLGAGGGTVVAQVFLERRMIAEAMASYTAEQQASRA